MTNTYHGAILLLNATPDTDTVEAIVADVTAQHFPSYECKHHLTDTLPEGAGPDVVDNPSLALHGLPEGATYLLVYPVGELNPTT